MNVQRGEVVLTRVPHAAGGRGKKRPAVVIQADRYNQSERFIIVAEITSNLSRAADPAHFFIEVATPDGKTSGLRKDSVVSCINLATIADALVARKIGQIRSDALSECSATSRRDHSCRRRRRMRSAG